MDPSRATSMSPAGGCWTGGRPSPSPGPRDLFLRGHAAPSGLRAERGSAHEKDPILAGVSTVAERLRQESRERLRRMTGAERLAEALRLGQRAIAAYAAAHALEPDAARRELERAAQAGRRASRVMDDLAG